MLEIIAITNLLNIFYNEFEIYVVIITLTVLNDQYAKPLNKDITYTYHKYSQPCLFSSYLHLSFKMRCNI